MYETKPYFYGTGVVSIPLPAFAFTTHRQDDHQRS